MNTNVKFVTIKNNRLLKSRIAHIRREGNYKFEPNIVLNEENELQLKTIGNKSKLSRSLSKQKHRLKKAEKELTILSNESTSEKKIDQKNRTIINIKKRIEGIQLQINNTIGGNQFNYRELTLSIPNASEYTRNDIQFQNDINKIVDDFVKSLKLGQIIISAQHLDQKSVHSHYIIDTEGTFSVRMKELDKYRGIQLKFNNYVRKRLDKRYGELDQIGAGRTYMENDLYKIMAPQLKQELNKLIMPKQTDKYIPLLSNETYYKKSYVKKLVKIVKDNYIVTSINDYMRNRIDNLAKRIEEHVSEISRYKREYDTLSQQHIKLYDLYAALKDLGSEKNLDQLKEIVKTKDNEIEDLNIEIKSLKDEIHKSLKDMRDL